MEVYPCTIGACQKYELSECGNRTRSKDPVFFCVRRSQFTSNAASVTSVEMYHAVHNQVETRAPIRKTAIIDLNGEPTLLAAYTCTPLVTIPLKDLKDGVRIVGKTIAELGWGSNPVDVVTFDAGHGPMVLLTNSHKSADLMSVSDIALRIRI